MASSSSLDKKDLEDFLSRVSEVEGLVHDIATSRDPEAITNALTNADEYLSTEEGRTTSSSSLDEVVNGGVIGFNRTIINPTSSPIHHSSSPQSPEGHASSSSSSANNSFNSEHEAFCRALEEDAQERASARERRLRLGKELKGKGNEAFREEHYELALTHYTSALEQLPGDTVLYTNRALVYLKLERYDDVLKDCETALKFNEKCVKGYLYKGKSLINLGRDNEARDCFKTALHKVPDKEATIRGYIKNIENWTCDL